MLTETMLLSIATTGFTVAFFHAALPTHWLPFVLAGRGQKWSKAKTLVITALASLGHVLFTTLLGVLVVLLGIETKNWTGDVFPMIAAGVLFLFGLYYFMRQKRGVEGHRHWKLPWMKSSHDRGHGSHAHDETHHIDTGHGIAVLSVFEEGVPPRFRLRFEDHRYQTPLPKDQTATIETIRPDGSRQLFTFVNRTGFLESKDEIPEPHEFKAKLRLAHGDHGHDYDVEYKEHTHSHEGHDHKDAAVHGPGCHPSHVLTSNKTDKAVILGLLAMLTFSPCEGFLPVYLSGIKYGWPGFVFLSALLALATMAGMVFFTWLTMAGLERLQLKTLEKYESGILGALLWVLAIIILVTE